MPSREISRQLGCEFAARANANEFHCAPTLLLLLLLLLEIIDAALWERGGEDLVDEDGHGATLLGGGIVPGRQRAVSMDGELKFWILSSGFRWVASGDG